MHVTNIMSGYDRYENYDNGSDQFITQSCDRKHDDITVFFYDSAVKQERLATFDKLEPFSRFSLSPPTKRDSTLTSHTYQTRMLLEELEHVDHILEEQGISLVKLDNPSAAFIEKFNVEIIPAIVHYQFKHPYFYKGDLTNEKKIVQWVLDIRENV